jgi:transcriptional regulator with XRE-family HTH domain
MEMALLVGRSRLPELLAKKRMSQAELARRLEVSEALISRIINGDGKHHFSYEKALNAAFILGCLAEELHEIIEQ